MRVLTTCLTMMLLLLLATGCRRKTDLDANGVPRTLIVAAYEGDNPGETSVVLEKVQKYLEGKLNMKVEYLQSTDYTTVIEAMVTGKAQMVFLSPFGFVWATHSQKR